MYDPFEEVEQPEEQDALAVLAKQLSRSMLWDMIGSRLQKDPEHFNQFPASPDVLEAEEKEMWMRKNSLLPFGMDFPFLCYLAADAASHILICEDEDLQKLDEEEITKFRYHNYKLGTAVTVAVLTHMLQRGLITYGERYEFLGEQD